MEDGARLAALVAELEADAAYATGRRAFPRTLTREDAERLAAMLHETVNEGTAARGRKAAEAGMTFACAPGCSYCCEQLVMVWLPEALAAAAFLERPENAAAKAAFLAAYPSWRERVGDGPERIAELTAAGKVSEHVQAHLEQQRKRVLCAFNQGGLCGIYDARPNVCRNTHALETAEHCRADDESGISVSFVQFKPLDDFLRRAGRMNAAMHHALGGGKQRSVALCEAVHELLTSSRKPTQSG
jgi:Fe-S-cluster containining protein